MKRPKNFPFAIVLVSVVALALAAVFYATRPSRPVTATATEPAPGMSRLNSPSDPDVGNPSPTGTSSDAARKRAKDFNDATNRFNAPDGQ